MAESGLIRGFIIGITALIITVMIAFVVVYNVEVVDDDIAISFTGSVVNETGGYLNGTSFTLDEASKTGFGSPVISNMVNVTGDFVIEPGNYTVSSAGVVTNISDVSSYAAVKVSYTYTWKETEAASDRLLSNYTSGIENISGKIPTLLLIAAVVLILGILSLLWKVYSSMNMEGGGGGGL